MYSHNTVVKFVLLYKQQIITKNKITQAHGE